MAVTGRRAGSVIRDAASTSPDAAAFRHRVLELLQGWVPFDAGCLGTTEPVTMLPTSLTTVGYDGPAHYPTAIDIEFGLGEEIGRFETMQHLSVPVRTLSQVTQGRPGSCRLYREILAPNGLRHEVRVLFRGRDGHAWGAATLARAGVDFTTEELVLLGAVLTDVGDGLRGTLFRDAAATATRRTLGPAVAVVGDTSELLSCTDAAHDYLARLGWGPDHGRVLAGPAILAAAWLRRSGQLSGTTRARTTDGEWVLIRCGLVAGSNAVLLTFEPAQARDLIPLAATAYGLTRREREVMVHLLADRSREEIARELFLSPYTVQDHLKSIYAKTGTSGRRGLVSLLVATECVPRVGSELGPDGWFVAHPR